MPVCDISDINITDYLHVKGVRLIDSETPQWQYKPIQEKNLKLITEYLVKFVRIQYAIKILYSNNSYLS